MSLFNRVFSEAVDRKYQQKRLNKLNNPIQKAFKDREDRMFQLGSYHPSYSDMSLQQSSDTDKLDRIKKLKTLIKAREALANSPDDEKLERKRDNALHAASSWHNMVRPTKPR